MEDGCSDMETFLSTIIAHAEYVLSQTPEMLPVLKQAGVVDSGGQGLITVLSGAFDAFLGKELDLSIKPSGRGKASGQRQAEAQMEIPDAMVETQQRQRSSSATARNSSSC